MENNNHKKNRKIGEAVLVIMSILFVAIGGSGLDSESIVMPIIFIMIGLACGVIAMFSDDEI